MMKLRSSRLTVAVLAAAAVILIAGGVATASNMGFKLNKALIFQGVAGSQVGKNWTSLPFNSPYPNVAALCSQTGLAAPPSPLPARVTILNDSGPLIGTFSSALCGSSGASSILLLPGRGAQIQQPAGTGNLTSIIIVGSHNPTLALTVLKAASGQQGNFWFSIPYHTTATTVRDLCIQAGLSSVGLPATVTRLNATTGLFSAPLCGSPAAGTTSLVLGEFVQIRDPGGPKTFIPAHF